VKNKLSDLYNHLFETLERLRDTKPVALDMEIKRATAVRMTAEQIIAAAKVEVEARKLFKNTPQSNFFEPVAFADKTQTAPKRLNAGSSE
jgi:hypothetical protein